MVKETVLLLGGAGFIGSHIAELYLERGATVIVLDDLSSGKKENLKTVTRHENFHFYKGSILDKELLDKLFTEFTITIVNNHAAQKSVPASVEDPLRDNEINVVGLLNILQCIKEHPIKRFIQASTGGALAKEIIGDETSSEVDLPQFASPYALTKFAVEQYLKIYGELYGFEYILLRYANVYGPRQVADGECGIVPIFVNNILENKTSLLMTYDDMPRGCTRDYIFVEDVAEFNKILLEAKSFESGVYNIGSGDEIAMLDIYETILDVFEKDVAIEIVGPRLGDIKRSVLNSDKLIAEFNWQPTMTLENGVKKLKEYYLK